MKKTKLTTAIVATLAVVLCGTLLTGIALVGPAENTEIVNTQVDAQVEAKTESIKNEVFTGTNLASIVKTGNATEEIDADMEDVGANVEDVASNEVMLENAGENQEYLVTESVVEEPFNESEILLGAPVVVGVENESESAIAESVSEKAQAEKPVMSYKSPAATAVTYTTPGLYSCGVLVKDWNTLISDGQIVVSGSTLTEYSSSFAGELVIDDSVTSIGIKAFYGCSELTGVVIPGSVKNIEKGAFAFCSALKSVVISDGAVSIGEHAFGWSELRSITIPDSVTSIGVSPFIGCNKLESITVSSGNAVYHSAQNCLIETATKTLIAGCKNSVIPADGSVVVIGSEAFYQHDELLRITIPNGVTTIEDRAFLGCDLLREVTIPDSVTFIGKHAFYWCKYLNTVTIGKNVEYIGCHAFFLCDLTTVTFTDTANWYCARCYCTERGIAGVSIDVTDNDYVLECLQRSAAYDWFKG